MENIVFYFSGTGNCLKAAKSIIETIGNGEIVSMAKSGTYTLKKQYDSIGFVYPTYFYGLPNKVEEFITNLDLSNNTNAYFYSLSTYGGFAGNSVSQLNELLKTKHNVKLHYGQKLQMFSNYIVLYNMSEKITEITKKSGEKLIPIINAIKNREKNTVKKSNVLFSLMHNRITKNTPNKDKNYTVSNNCTGCGICKEVCPVKNIELINGKPAFNHHCEQCVACVQFCPQKAINYKNATQKRRRYTHPEIGFKELSERNQI
jgi:ferredoxin/flavodoxin